MMNLEKIKQELIKTCPCIIFPPLFLIFQISSSGGVNQNLLPPLKKGGPNYGAYCLLETSIRQQQFSFSLLDFLVIITLERCHFESGYNPDCSLSVYSNFLNLLHFKLQHPKKLAHFW